MFVIPDATSLVSYLQDFTGSTNDAEIKQCIFQAELAMRNIELPALRTNPYETFGTVGAGQLMPIPADMNKPILFFQQGTGGYSTTATATGDINSNIINLTSVPGQGLQIGMSVSGTGIATGAIIISFNTSTQIVLSLNNTSAVATTLTFATTQSMNAVTNGPWIVYDRIGDRDIITQGMIAQLYLSPVNAPIVIRGKFSEVGQNYQFLPYVGEGTLINLYYYRAWDLLFTPTQDNTVISADGTINGVSGSGPWTVTIGGMSTTSGLSIGDTVSATDGTGILTTTGGAAVVAGIGGSTTMQVTVTGGNRPITGTITDISRVTTGIVETNPVLQTWPEGYIYNSLHEYYTKRHSAEDAAMYKQKAIDAWKTVEDQNSLGKWSGGHTRLTSIFQPRTARSYAVK